MKRDFKRYLGAGETEAGFNLSWGSIIAGVVTILALLITFSLIGSAIGLGVTDPTSSNPFDGVGLGLTIWTVVAFVLAFFGGGFLAGVASRRVGLLHGFLTWASSLILLVIMISYLASGIFSMAGSILGGVVNVTGDAVQTGAEVAGDSIAAGFDNLAEEVGTVDTEELEDQVTSVLEDTDVPELQPDYIENEISAALDEVVEAGQEIIVNPENSEAIIDELLTSLESRASEIGDAADEEAIANAVASNTDLSEEEADQAVENITNALETASEEAQTAIQNIRVEVERLEVELEQTIQEARVTADEATDTGAEVSIWAFVALLLSLILTSIAGVVGSNTVKMSDVEEKV